MFFPYNVDSQVKSSKKADAKTKNSFFMVLFGIGVIVLYFILRDIGIQFGLPRWIAIVLTLLISSLVGFILLRFFVFNEKFLLESEEDSKSDSLGKYYKIRESELPRLIDGIEVFENTDGVLCACIEVLYGPNSRQKSEFTLAYLKTIFSALSQFSLDFRAYVAKENFLRSKECKNFLSTVNNNHTSTELKLLVSEMSDLILGFTEEKSFLYTTFIIVRFPAINATSLKSLRNKFNEIVSNKNSSIRSIEFVDRARYREFIKEYNLVEALDLSNYKANSLPSNVYRKYKNNIFVISGTDTKYEYKNGVKTK